MLIEVGQHIVDYVSSRVCGGAPLGWAMGIGTSRDGVICGGVALYQWNRASLWMHTASEGDKRWVSRGYLHFLFDYIFEDCGARCVSGFIDENNVESINFHTRLGFREVSRLKNACPEGDMLLFSMQREECRWVSQPA